MAINQGHHRRPLTPVGGRRLFALCAALGLVLLVAVCRAGDPPPASAPQTGPRPFQPGVLIDWHAPAVIVECEVVLRRGSLEFLACLSGKEHESILRLGGSATHIYAALGLIGLNPGHPPVWDPASQSFSRPAGDLVSITCEWEQDGQRRVATAGEWLREIEYARPVLDRPWVFAGSVRRDDGLLAADRSGVGIALVDFPDSLLSLSHAYPSQLESLWAAARTEVIPPAGTPVRLVLRPAQPQSWRLELDFRGELSVDGRFATVADVADLLRMGRQLAPDSVNEIAVHGALAADVRRVREGLLAEGVPADAFRLVPEKGTSSP